MKFKQYLKEMEGVAEQDPNVTSTLSKIKIILNSLSSEDIDDFGNWLYDAIYDDDYDEDNDDYDDYDDYDDKFDLDEVIEMVSSLNSEDLQFVLDNLKSGFNISDEDIANLGAGNTEKSYDDDGDGDIDESELNEKKFFKKKKIQLDREKKKNISQRRKNKKLRRLYYKRHKAIIKRKQKKYIRKVKRNPNMVRHHR